MISLYNETLRPKSIGIFKNHVENCAYNVGRLYFFKTLYFAVCIERASQVAWWLTACLPVQTGDLGSIPESGRTLGEGNGNPLWYSYLGNPMDRGAWQVKAGGHKSQTRLGMHAVVKGAQRKFNFRYS